MLIGLTVPDQAAVGACIETQHAQRNYMIMSPCGLNDSSELGQFHSRWLRTGPKSGKRVVSGSLGDVSYENVMRREIYNYHDHSCYISLQYEPN